jgi:hypothetical protein
MSEKKALVIFGNQASGKTKKAIFEAKKISPFSIIISSKQIFNRFTLGSILTTNPGVVIVEDCTFEFLNDPNVKLLISEDDLLVERKGKDPKLVSNVKWIFTVCIDRQFSVITV